MNTRSGTELPLSQDELDHIFETGFRKLIIRGSLFMAGVLISAAVITYFNKLNPVFSSEDNLGVLNVVFVIIAVICARMLVSEWIEFRRETKAKNKKVLNLIVRAVREGHALIDNREFSSSDFMFDSSDLGILKPGDRVVLEVTTGSGRLLSLKKG